jgi:hypothetical protein
MPSLVMECENWLTGTTLITLPVLREYSEIALAKLLPDSAQISPSNIGGDSEIVSRGIGNILMGVVTTGATVSEVGLLPELQALRIPEMSINTIIMQIFRIRFFF